MFLVLEKKSHQDGSSEYQNSVFLGLISMESQTQNLINRANIDPFQIKH